MPRIEYEALPPEARVWAFAASEPLAAEVADELMTEVDAFLDGWNAHGHPLAGARRWDDARFLLVGVDERTAPPSGCSIDALHHVLKDFEARHGVGLTDHIDVLYRDPDGRILRRTRPEFARLARSGEVDLDTPVFDLTITRKSQVDAGFEVPARDAWHQRAFWRGPAPT